MDPNPVLISLAVTALGRHRRTFPTASVTLGRGWWLLRPQHQGGDELLPLRFGRASVHLWFPIPPVPADPLVTALGQGWLVLRHVEPRPLELRSRLASVLGERPRFRGSVNGRARGRAPAGCEHPPAFRCTGSGPVRETLSLAG